MQQQTVDPTADEGRFRRLPAPIRLEETGTLQDTRAINLGAGVLPIAAAVGFGGDGGACDGDGD